jgi:copper chaperone CopZ
MKNNILFILAALFIASCSSGNANLKTEKFTVYGNCEMCKKTIEGSLDGVKGIDEATWNVKNDKMTVSFDPEVITLEKIKQKIADVGYDSDSHRAKDKVYEDLHGCCKYERPE